MMALRNDVEDCIQLIANMVTLIFLTFFTIANGFFRSTFPPTSLWEEYQHYVRGKVGKD